MNCAQTFPPDEQASLISAAPRSLLTATVRGRAGKWLFLDGAIERALRADSCLIEPENGDLVLVCAVLPVLPPTVGVAASMSVPYVLAVLTAAESISCTLTLPGGASLKTADGELRLNAAQIALNASELLSATTCELNLQSVTTKLVTQHADTRIGVLDAGIGRITLAAKSFISNVSRLLQRTKESYRWVEGTDELRAGNSRWRVKGHAHMHTRHTTFLSDALTRVDGSKIELG